MSHNPLSLAMEAYNLEMMYQQQKWQKSYITDLHYQQLIGWLSMPDTGILSQKFMLPKKEPFH